MVHSCVKLFAFSSLIAFFSFAVILFLRNCSTEVRTLENIENWSSKRFFDSNGIVSVEKEVDKDKFPPLHLRVLANHEDIQNQMKLSWIAPDPEIKMNATQLIAHYGFPFEEHYVQTSDGYILGMQRIPQPSKSRIPVLLMHGLLSSSDCFLTNLVNESLAYILYKAGYDVWLGNVRGNTYSTRHVSLSPDSLKFWKWSFDEMGHYDIPAMVNYVLKATDQEKLDYIGHSQGTTTFFAAAVSQSHKFSSKINRFFALAPAGLVPHMKSPLHYLAFISRDIQDLFYLFGDGQFLPHEGWIARFADLFCPVEYTLCENVLFLFGGNDLSNTNRSRVPVYTAHNPAGTSAQNMVHWAQMYQNKKDQMKYYDYGNFIANLYHYKRFSPPTYDFNNVHIPTYIFCGTKDTLVVQCDCEKLVSILPNVKKFSMIEGYTHLDFIWAVNAAPAVYDSIVKDLAHNV